MKYKFKINLLASWAHHVASLLFGLILMPFVLNTIGDDNYGLWLFICSIAGYSGLVNLGFGDTVSRFVAHHSANNDITGINRVVNSIGAVYFAISLLVGVVAGLIAWLAPLLFDWGTVTALEVRWVIVLLGLNVIVGLLGSVYGGVVIGLQRIDLERAAGTLSGIARLVLTLSLLTVHLPLLTLAAIFLITTIIENVTYVAIVRRKLPQVILHWKHLHKQTLKECTGFSLYALLDNISGKLIDATDTVVIGMVFGSRFIIPYYVAHRLMTFIVSPLRVIGLVAMPRGAELGANRLDSRLQDLVSKGLGLALLLTSGFTIGAWYFGDHAITAWLGRTYPETRMLLVVLLATQIVATPLRVIRGVLFGMGRVELPSVIYFAEAIANLVLTLLLVKPFGLMGVALGTAIPVVVLELGVMLPYALRAIRFEWRAFLTRVVLPQIPPLVALWWYAHFVNSHWAVPQAWLPVIAVSAGGGAVLLLTWSAGRYAFARPQAA